MTYGSNKAHRPADHHPWRNSIVPVGTAASGRERTCGRCKETKPLTEYHLSRRQGYCKECVRAIDRARALAKKEGK